VSYKNAQIQNFNLTPSDQLVWDYLTSQGGLKTKNGTKQNALRIPF